VVRNVAADEDHVHGEHHRAAEHERVAAIQAAESFRRHGEKIEARECGEGAGPDPLVDPAPAENGEQQRNDHDAGTSDESGLRRRCEFQSRGLEGVASEHEEADLRASPDRAAPESAQ